MTAAPAMAAALLERRAARRAEMLSSLLPEQRAAIEDPSLRKAWFCTRRSGKSWGIGNYLFLTALAFPASSCLYTGLTKDTARRVMCKDILRVQNAHFRIGAQWKESKNRWELPNGSHIYLQGADANQYEWRKVVGQKYRLAVCDEASKYRQDLRAAIYGELLPAMGDDAGTVVLSGVPSNVTQGLFFDITGPEKAFNGTKQREPGWSTHSWSWRQNTFRLANLQRMHDELVEANPAIVETPLYRQEWLGQWVIDTSALVYRFAENRNTAASLPRNPKEYTYILGLDLGYSDPTAFAVVAYHEHDPTLYVVEAFKRSWLNISDVAAIVRELWAKYPFSSMVADASQLQGVEEMRQRKQLPLESAEKAGKRGVIEVMNSDLLTGRIKLLPAANDGTEERDVSKEWGALIWDEKKLAGSPPRWEEDPRFPNHLADAILYAWRKARNYLVTDEKPAPIRRDDPNWGDAHFQAELDARAHPEDHRWPRQIQVDRAPPGRR